MSRLTSNEPKMCFISARVENKAQLRRSGPFFVHVCRCVCVCVCAYVPLDDSFNLWFISFVFFTKAENKNYGQVQNFLVIAKKVQFR